MVTALLYLSVGFLGMELASWLIHKYLMHGPLWNIHVTHHKRSKGFFELNDIFSFIFGSVSVALIVYGSADFSSPFWIGMGIATYGMVYFVIHDVLIHRRIKNKQKINNWYLKALYRAHLAHHKTIEKEDSESFGLLLIHPKFFKNNK